MKTIKAFSILAVVLIMMGGQKVTAQYSLEFFNQDAIGIGFWYGWGSFQLDAAANDTDSEVIGYTDILPSTITGGGFAFGISYGYIGFNYGQDENKIDIDEFAEVQQNNNSSDDVFVYTAKRLNRSLSILVQPMRYLYIGAGYDEGHFEFEQKASGGSKETNKVGYRNDFLSFGLAGGFDPTQTLFAPIFTAYIKIPRKRGDFSGVLTGIGAGLYF